MNREHDGGAAPKVAPEGVPARLVEPDTLATPGDRRQGEHWPRWDGDAAEDEARFVAQLAATLMRHHVVAFTDPAGKGVADAVALARLLLAEARRPGEG